MITINQVIELYESMVGWQEIGVDGNGEVVSTPKASVCQPLLRALFPQALGSWNYSSATMEVHTERKPRIELLADIFETLASVCHQHLQSCRNPELTKRREQELQEKWRCEGVIVTHHRGGIYRTQGLYRHCKSGELWMAYQSVESNERYTRPLRQFDKKFWVSEP